MFEWIWNFFYRRSTDCLAAVQNDKLLQFQKKRAVKIIEQAYLKYKARAELRAILDKKMEAYAKMCGGSSRTAESTSGGSGSKKRGHRRNHVKLRRHARKVKYDWILSIRRVRLQPS